MLDRDGTRRCPARGCEAPADVLYEGRWTCVRHVSAESGMHFYGCPVKPDAHRPEEPFEAEADGMGESRLPRFARKR